MTARAIFDEQVLPLFEQRHGGWIAQARAAARLLAGQQGQVTINDVRAVCPPPDGADPRIMGSVFAKREFERIGFTPSRRGECHGRMIGVFRLRQAAPVEGG